MGKKIKIILIILVPVLILTSSFYIMFLNSKSDQKIIIAKNKPIIKVNGLNFKDLNNNGKLDDYEDWRLTSNQRADDLVNQMTLEEKAGMLVINTQYSAVEQYDKSLTSHNGLLNEEKASDDIKIFLNYVGNTETIVDLNIRHVINRESLSAENMAKWNNALNEVAESTRLGIPVQITSNPKNHMGMILADYKNDLNTIYPSTLGIAAAGLGEQKTSGTLEVVKNFAQTVKREFESTGIRKGYMYCADVMTDPRWLRNSETFGENVDFVCDATEILVKTLQGGNSINNLGLSLTLKHFPGSGARKNGLDGHYESGRYTPFVTENSLENYHLKPFQVAIDNNVASIMPYYSQPDPNSAKQTYNGEEINMATEAFTYNTEFLTNLLRNNMGFEGYINTDSGVIDFICWGQEDKTNVEKVAKAINSGVDLISDTNNVEWILDAVEQKLLTEEKVNESVKRVLIEMFEQGLFENPYVDVENAKNVVASEEAVEEAYEAHQKSVVLLKNSENTLPIKSKTENEKIKIYVKEYGTSQRLKPDALATRTYDVEIVEDYNQADYFITYLSGETTDEIVFNLNIKDIMKDEYNEWVKIGNTIKENGGKRITIINMKTAYLLGGIEEYSDSIVLGFDTYTCAIMDVIVGNFNPTGVLPFTLPASESVVAIDENGNCASPNDVPGYDKSKYLDGLKYEYIDSDGNIYLCGHGLSY